MSDDNSSTQYQSPSVNRWGTVLDLTASGDVGGSGDDFVDNTASVDCPPASDNGEGEGEGCGGS